MGLPGLSFASDESVVRPRAGRAKNATMRGFQAGILPLPFLDPKSEPLPAYTLRLDAQDERSTSFGCGGGAARTNGGSLMSMTLRRGPAEVLTHLLDDIHCQRLTEALTA